MTHIKPLEIELPLEVYKALQEMSRYNSPSILYQVLTAKESEMEAMTSSTHTVRAYLKDIEMSGVQHHGQHLMQLLTGQYKVAKKPEEVLVDRIRYYIDVRAKSSGMNRVQFSEYARTMILVCHELDIDISDLVIPRGLNVGKPVRSEKWPSASTYVVNAVKDLSRRYDTHEIYTWVMDITLSGEQPANQQVKAIADWYHGYHVHEDRGTALMKLLVGDHGTHYTNEQKLGQMYDTRRQKIVTVSTQSTKRDAQFQIEAIHESANILGLDIDGITNVPFTTERARPYTKRTDEF